MVERGTLTQVVPPSVDRAIALVEFVLLDATQIPFEYPIELQTGKGANADAADIALHPPLKPLCDGRDEYQKTISPLPPMIHCATPVPFAPALPYATDKPAEVGKVHSE